MDEQAKQHILDYIKDGLGKGYTEDQLRKILDEHRVPPDVMEELFMKAKPKKEFKPLPKETLQPQLKPEIKVASGKSHSRLFSLLFVFLGLILMVAVYIARIFFLPAPETEPAYPLAGLFRALWPIVFPLMANLLNFFLFRKRFLVGLIITVVVVAILIGTVLLLAFLGA